MNFKGIQYAGLESRLVPTGAAPPVIEEFTSRAQVIYLRDLDHKLYAAVHTDLPEVPLRGWKALEATKLRHRKSGRSYHVANVEVATRMVRLKEDIDPNTGEPLRTRWYPVDDFDVLGLPTDPRRAQEELAFILERAEELRAMLMPQQAAPADPVETPEQKKARLWAELQALEAEATPIKTDDSYVLEAEAPPEAPKKRGRT